MTAELEASFAGPAVTPPHEVRATPLDDARQFLGWFVDASTTQLDVLAAFAASTHVLQDAFGRAANILITSEEPESGKTETQGLTLALCANGWNVTKETTKDAIRVRYDCPADKVPTIGIGDTVNIWGESGRSGASHPVTSYLRDGYKAGATVSISRSGVPVDLPIFTSAIMAGLKNAVPKDIRTRCIVVKMRKGRPQLDYDFHEHDGMADMLSAALSSQFRRCIPELRKFRAKGLHPRLTGRKREIWEPLFAIAHANGGDWPKRMMAAFLDLAMDQGDEVKLTPMQVIIRDMRTAAEIIGTPRIAGADMVGSLLGSRERMYEGMTERSLAMFMAKAMEPAQPFQFRADDGRVVRGYTLADIQQAAASRLPAEPDEGQEEAEQDAGLTIFDVPEVVTGDESLTSDVATVTTVATPAA
jgi:Protein of unknown function (DUF3631)